MQGGDKSFVALYIPVAFYYSRRFCKVGKSAKRNIILLLQQTAHSALS